MTVLLTSDPIVRAAINRFAEDGFDAPLRKIAGDADVSAALLIKRFGSKENLRRSCDTVVLESIRIVKQRSIRGAASGDLLGALASKDEYAPLLSYTMQSVLRGGDMGRTFIEHMIEDAIEYMRDAVEQGVVRPSRDELARTRYLVLSSIGAFLLSMQLHPTNNPADLSAMMRRVQMEIAPPMIEVFSQGVFFQPHMLDKYLLYLSDPPGEEAPIHESGIVDSS